MFKFAHYHTFQYQRGPTPYFFDVNIEIHGFNPPPYTTHTFWMSVSVFISTKMNEKIKLEQ